MWFTENAANQVASITAQGKITVYALPGAASGPRSIVYGPDGNLWFTDNTGVGSIDPSTGKVSLYRAHTASSGPVGITVGPDCTSIWFTESSADRLGRVAPIPNTTGCKPGSPIAVPEAPLSFSPSPLAFGGVVAGGPGVTKTLKVTNASGQSVTLGRFSWGDYVGNVAITTYVVAKLGTGTQKPGGGCGPGTVLAAGKSCVLFVTLKTSKTSAAGLAGATLNIVVTGPAGAALGVATLLVTNAGTGPLSFSPSPLALGDVVVGNSGGVTKTLTVRNLTSESITLGALGYDRTAVGTGTGLTRFTVDASKSTCGVGVVLGRVGESEKVTKSCDFVVTFTVSTVGAFGATLSLASTGQNRAALPAATLPFSGTGVK